MIPRGRLDVGWSDFIAGAIHCARPARRSDLERRVEHLSAGASALICLSVRSGLDLFLTAMNYPPGSEILVSAVTIRNMVDIIEHHGLVAVPVDVDMTSLTVKIDSLERAVSPKSKAVLVAHLFGSRMDLGPIARVAHAHGLPVIEDCAQSFARDGYWGHPESDVAITSFGPLKTATALGGAVARVKDPALLDRMRAVQSAYPIQSRWAFFKRVARFALIRALMYPLPFEVFYRFCRATKRNHDDVFSQAIRGFTGEDFFRKIRHRPSAPLLALMARRISGRGDRWVADRTATAELAAGLMPRMPRPGTTAARHSHWVFPVLSPTPDRLAAHLWTRGFDATRGKWSLYVVQAPASRPEMRAEEANAGMSQVVYTPVYPVVKRSDLERLASAMDELESPVAIVTGAASGIGRHWAETLRGRGFRLALADVDRERLESIFEPSDSVRLHGLDIRSVEGWTRMAEDTVTRFGRIDYLFNIAGGGRPGFLLDVPMELVDTTIDVNLKGQIYGMKVVGPIMRNQGSGQIVNMSSLAGISPTPGNELYSAAKSGLRSVSISTAIRLRPVGVYVTVVCPDLVDTPTIDRHLRSNPTDVALIHSGPGALSVRQVEGALWEAMRDRPLEIALPRSRGWLVRINNLFPPIMLRLYAPLMRKGLRRIERLRRERMQPALPALPVPLPQSPPHQLL